MAFDHDYIEANDVTNRYVRKTLSADDRRRFEQHFPDCPECLDRLALAELFNHPSSAPRQRPHPFVADFLRLPPARQKMALALAALVIGGCPTAFFLGSWFGLRRQMEESPKSATLLLVNPASPEFSSYGVAVTDSAGKVVRATTGIHLKPGQILGLPVLLSGLPSGDYKLTIRGRRTDGSTTLVQSYALRTVPEH